MVVPGDKGDFPESVAISNGGDEPEELLTQIVPQEGVAHSPDTIKYNKLEVGTNKTGP